MSQRKFAREFKLAAVQGLKQGESVAALARVLEVSPNLPYRWQSESPGTAFLGLGRRRAEPDRVAQLERKIGQQALEIDSLKGCLQRSEARWNSPATAGRA